MLSPEASILDELEKQKSPFAPSLLSREEKDRLLQRAFHSLYRWYLDRSQTNRNWNPDRSFNWRGFGQNHSHELLTILEGFYAVEQYAPDYTAELTRLTRANYGRSQYQLRWGAEEEKHADLWRNTLLFSRARTPEWVEQYTADLRANSWSLPYTDPIRMLLYTVIQERATQLNYLNLYKIASGKSEKPQFMGDADPVLAKACVVIAKDEAAHFEFFIEGARLYLYYYPEETLCALVDVLNTFWMPAMEMIPGMKAFTRAVFEGGVFDGRQYSRDVIKVALRNLGIESIRSVERGLAHARLVPDTNGEMRDTALFEGVDFFVIHATIERLFARLDRYEAEIGIFDIDPVWVKTRAINEYPGN